MFTDNDLTFMLTKRGWYSGILSEPADKRRHFRMSQSEAGALCVGPDA